MKGRLLTEEHIKSFINHLRMEEKSKNTIEKYTRDVNTFATFLNGMGNFVVVGLVAGQRSDIEFVLKNPLYSRVIPQIFQADFRLVVTETLAEKLLLIVGR